MKKWMAVYGIAACLILLGGCAEETAVSQTEVPGVKLEEESISRPESSSQLENHRNHSRTEEDFPENAAEPKDSRPEGESGKQLVVYFSCTGNTEQAAKLVWEAVPGSELYEIIPAQPYTDADLDYSSDCRANREQESPAARPEISGSPEGLESCEVIYLGYPIWWGKTPKIIYTFLESSDFSGKTIVPFCTSGSSPFSGAGLAEAAPGAVIAQGKNLNNADAASVAEWLDRLELPNAG